MHARAPTERADLGERYVTRRSEDVTPTYADAIRDTILGLPTPSWFLKMVSRAGASSIQRLTYFLKVSRFVLAGWRFDVDVMRQVSTRASIRA